MEQAQAAEKFEIAALLAALARIAPPTDIQVTEATATDMVSGVAPRVVVKPRDEEGVAAVLRYASSEGLAVIPRGGGTQLDCGAPPRRADIILSLARLSGLIEHAPQDLTFTVRAGTPLIDLQRELGAASQWLALDPPLAAGATVGGIIATNATGPRRQRYLGVRDQIIGIRVALADGTIARGGGKVVKNVAGYDLPKLFCGSLGTLGVILAASFRLYPIPPFSGSALIEAQTPEPLGALALRILALPVTPVALDLFPKLESGRAPVLAVRFESAVTGAIDDQITTISDLARDAGLEASATRDAVDSEWWIAGDDWMAEIGEHGAETLDLKASLPPTDVSTWLDKLEAARADLTGLTALRWRARMGLGIVVARLTGAPEAVADWAEAIQRLRAAAVERRGSLIVTHTPPALRGRLDPWGPANGLALMRSLKERFDPQATLNPGRFVGGI
jgi:glycolate oxidase FAD binding subunit